MKRISLILVALLFAVSARAEDSASLLHTPAPSALLSTGPGAGVTALKAGVVELSEKESRDLLSATGRSRIRLPSLESFTGNETGSLDFKPFDLFAPGASIRLVQPSGVTLVAPTNRLYLMASNTSTSIGLSVDPASGEITGMAARNGERLEISGLAGIGLELKEIAPLPDDVNSCATDSASQPQFDLAAFQSETPRSQSAAASGTALNYQTVVAVDTDTEWMAGKGNNATTATNWITDIFMVMNVFYERDIETRLLLGDITLRIGPDPYSVPSNRSDQLDEFGNHWRFNMTGIDRDFAAMFSGRSISSGSFSGIAWVNVYCNTGHSQGSSTVGSYSFNAIGTGRTPANTGLYVGHEIGHNLGSPHTHCYSPAVDQCYNAQSGCYSGPVSCPSGGKGTVMSYCHVGGSSGAGCGTSNQEFHPTVQGLLESRIAANSPSCIAPYQGTVTEMVFGHGFEN